MISTIDFDNNGNDEIVLHDKQGKLMSVYKLGNNTDMLDATITNGGDWDFMTTGDFDADGQDEIVCYRNEDGKITVYNPEKDDDNLDQEGSTKKIKIKRLPNH